MTLGVHRKTYLVFARCKRADFGASLELVDDIHPFAVHIEMEMIPIRAGNCLIIQFYGVF